MGLPQRDEDVDTVMQPDISVICDKAKLDERGLWQARRAGASKHHRGDGAAASHHRLGACFAGGVRCEHCLFY